MAIHGARFLNTESDNMAGSDKKEQQLATGQTPSGGAAPLDVQPPDVRHIVIDGDTSGLIPRAKLDTDQTITLAAWFGSNPPDGETDTFRLQIAHKGSNEWETLYPEQTYTGGAAWQPLPFTLPSTFMLNPEKEGGFDLRYEHENYNFVTDYSVRVPIHIDKVPPNGAIPPAKMGFAFTPPITDATFGADDFLEFTIPAWTGDLTDVKVMFGWIKGELPEKPEDIDLSGPVSIVANGKVQIPKDKFIAAGDGACCGGYVLIDKAGNISSLSRYELMSVALGPAPTPVPLPAPQVTDATGGELLRSDIVNGGVIVKFGRITNGKATDQIALKWGGTEVANRMPVGSNPATHSFFVPWDHIKTMYGASKGAKPTDVQFIVYRGLVPYPSAIISIDCNLSNTGPDNPNPEPGNPNLKVVKVFGKSNDENRLIDTDENEDVFAKIELVAPLSDGDTYQVKWNGTDIGAPYVVDVTNDNVGDIIEILLDWDTIRDEGASATMPVWYVLTNVAHESPQEPETRTSVDIDFLVIHLPAAEALHLNPVGTITCNSLRWNAGNTTYGIEFRIPPSLQLKAGDTVVAEYKAFTDFANPVEVEPAAKSRTFPVISDEQAAVGIVWLIEPYTTHILPTWSKDKPLGKVEVVYTITGKSAVPTPTNTKIGLAQGEGSCNIPPAPNP
jgi:hypothetical protein